MFDPPHSPSVTFWLEYFGKIKPVLHPTDSLIKEWPFCLITGKVGSGVTATLEFAIFERSFRRYPNPAMNQNFVIGELTRKRIKRHPYSFFGDLEFVEFLLYLSNEDFQERKNGWRFLVEISEFGFGSSAESSDYYQFSAWTRKQRAFALIRMVHSWYDQNAQIVASIDFHRPPPCICTRHKQCQPPTSRLTFFNFLYLAKAVLDVNHGDQSALRERALTTEESVRFATTLMRVAALYTGAELYERPEIPKPRNLWDRVARFVSDVFTIHPPPSPVLVADQNHWFGAPIVIEDDARTVKLLDGSQRTEVEQFLDEYHEILSQFESNRREYERSKREYWRNCPGIVQEED